MQWTLSTLIAFPLFSLVAILLFSFAILCFVSGVAERREEMAKREAADKEEPDEYNYRRRDLTDYRTNYWAGFWVTLLGVVVATSVAWAMFPWSAEYHQWRDATVKVETVNSRVAGGTDTYGQQFLFHSGDNDYVCDDTRCAGIKPGDVAYFMCKPSYDHTASPRRDCKYINVTHSS